MNSVNHFLHDWLVLFSMVNAVGNLPVFADLTSEMDAQQRSRAFRTAILTAAMVVLTFAFFGSWMLKVAFEVDTEAFKIAGGILVFIVAARGMLVGHPRVGAAPHAPTENVAVFPMGFPFLAGPGTIVTTILLLQSEGTWLTALAAVLVYAAILPLLYLSPLLHLAIGRVGVLVVARILYIFVASKAVAFVLSGLAAYFGNRGSP
ncbi:MAG: MarC family protein [Candidatus Anammoximicrobium sp.]|nr:MarC family protein [Candidatus Anammoximicrobium sp.]